MGAGIMRCNENERMRKETQGHGINHNNLKKREGGDSEEKGRKGKVPVAIAAFSLDFQCSATSFANGSRRIIRNIAR
jgi:hypothetical protein